VVWIAVSRCAPVVNSIRRDAQEAPPNSEIKEVFNAALDSSIQRIAVALVKLFFYLRVKFLDLRRVSRLLAQGTSKYKTMLRKVYTVATTLEILGIVKKTNVVAEIQLRIPLDSETCDMTLKVASLLNTDDQVKQEMMYDRRRREFSSVCAELSQTQRNRPIQPGMTPVSRSLAPYARG
jgi:hypothetical protein